MIGRGQLQLRGRLRWLIRRLRVRQRYGRAALLELPIVFGNAIPKNGSKLLFNILRGLPEIGPFVDAGLAAIKPYRNGRPTPPEWIAHQLDQLRPGDVRLGYLHATIRNIEGLCRPGWAVFQILRDPRDSLISSIFYATEMHASHGMRAYYETLDSMEKRISAAILGVEDPDHPYADIHTKFARYLGWLDRPEICLIRFEDLTSEPERELERILDRLEESGFVPHHPRANMIAALRRQMDPRKSQTFRKGSSGTWREHFTARNKAQFKDIAGELLLKLGYERDTNW